MTDEKNIVLYGSQEIKFNIYYSNRKTLEIAVHPDCHVAVKAPADSDIKKIHKLVFKRARWIIKQQDFFQQFLPRTDFQQYLSGETHLYLGRRYRLKIIESDVNDIVLSRGLIFVMLNKGIDRDKVKERLISWYNTKAKAILPEIVQECWNSIKNLDAKKPTIQIKTLKTRWGSLSENNTLMLNTNLIKAPKECIKYVIIHELCHLKYYNHSNDFYNLLEKFMPDWKKIKHKLEVQMA